MKFAMRRAGVCLGMTLAALTVLASPATAHVTPAEEANKKVVLDFYAALNAADAAGTTAQQARDIIMKYIGESYMQHSEQFKNMPGPGSDRDKLIRMFQSMPAMPKGVAPPMPTTEAIMAEGDKVMMLTSRKMNNPQTGTEKQSFIFNMFRVKDGKLVEHWDVSPGMSGGGAPGAGAPPAGMPAGGPPPGMTPPPGAN